MSLIAMVSRRLLFPEPVLPITYMWRLRSSVLMPNRVCWLRKLVWPKILISLLGSCSIAKFHYSVGKAGGGSPFRDSRRRGIGAPPGPNGGGGGGARPSMFRTENL